MKHRCVALAAGVAFLCVLFVAVVVIIAAKHDKVNDQCLLVILVDGVRFDYVTRDEELIGFPKLAAEGVKADYLNPIYPSNSYPNWYSILTGLFAESHGMVQNRMYDPLYHDFFLMNNANRTHEHWWADGTPIWALAPQHGIKTSVYNWDGCQVAVNGWRPHLCTAYQLYYRWKSVNVDTTKILYRTLDDFANGTYRLSLLYYEPVDHLGHKYGPDANETVRAVREIDLILYNLLNEIERKGLEDKVNVYVMSDHGMSKPMNRINLEDHINFTDVKYMLDKGSLSMVLPKNENASERIVNHLTAYPVEGLIVHRKEEIPRDMHIRGHRRVLPILLRARPNYYMEAPPSKKIWPSSNSTERSIGHHGYYAKEFSQMKGIMFAKGPAFKSGTRIASIEQVDHYQVFCHVLGIKPLANNGSWARVSKFIV